MSELDIKHCTTCGAFKQMREFSRRKKSPDGRQHACKACDKVYAADYRKENPERIAALAAKHKARISAERAALRATKGSA
jgi:hypothetical protein